jgi:hypothetical protein
VASSAALPASQAVTLKPATRNGSAKPWAKERPGPAPWPRGLIEKKGSVARAVARVSRLALRLGARLQHQAAGVPARDQSFATLQRGRARNTAARMIAPPANWSGLMRSLSTAHAMSAETGGCARITTATCATGTRPSATEVRP